MKPPARAVVGNLVWSRDGGVWALWRVPSFAHAHTAVPDKLAVHAHIRGLLVGLPPESMLLSVCERLDPMDVVDQMAEGVDLDRRPAWGEVCEATVGWLDQVMLHRRRFYLAAALPATKKAGWKDLVGTAVGDVGAAFGLSPRAVPADEVAQRRRQARELEHRLIQHVPLVPVSAGEVCWLYARALRRGRDEPALDEMWEPSVDGDDRSAARAGAGAGTASGRPRGVLAHLTDVVLKEGGDREDEDRPRHRRYVRIDHGQGSSYQTVFALSDMPHYFTFPGGGGEWLYFADHAGFPVDWCVRVRSVRNVDAQAKVRRKHRDLVGQVGEYDGDTTGAPPALAEAIQSIDHERSELGANPAEPEVQATILLSIAADSLAELESKAGALASLFEPQDYGLARPTGGQVALLRSMLPGTSAAAVCKDYTQFMLARDLAAGSPFCGADIGDPTGLLLGVSLDGGGGTPVLFDPAFGPKTNTSPSLAAVGRLGSGKSFFLKRLCWDTVARGGQVVTIDRTRSGEYVRFAESVTSRVQVVRLDVGADVSLDPLRSFFGDERETVTLGFLSLLAGCSAQSEEGAALAEAVDTVVGRPEARLVDVVDELARQGSGPTPDDAARGLARRLAHYRRSPAGQLAFGAQPAVSLDADFIVFWAPSLALPDRETLASEHRSRMLLPEQVLGQALLYLVAAVGRRVVFSDPSRFAAALYDEAWALLASPFGQSLLIEGVRDGRKHNGAIWLASQHPNDFAVSELQDLLGSRFVFRQARQAVPASLRFLGVSDSADAAATLEQGLGTGQCLYRDVRDRVGLIQILPPAIPELEPAFDTSPGRGPRDERALQAGADGEVAMAELIEDVDAEPLVTTTPGGAAGDLLMLGRAVVASAVPDGPGEMTVLGPAAVEHPPADGWSDIPEAPGPVEDAPQVAAEDAARDAARRRRRTPLATALAEQEDE